MDFANCSQIKCSLIINNIEGTFFRGLKTKKHPSEGMLYGRMAVADMFQDTSQLSLKLDNAVYAHWFLCKFFDKDVCRMHVFQSKTVGDVVDCCTVTIICKSFC